MIKEKADLIPRIRVRVSTMSSLWIYEGIYFLKMIENGQKGDEELEQYRVDSLEREFSMMLLASDCALQPVGRIYLRGTLCGIIMPLGIPISRDDSPFMNEEDVPQPPVGSIPSPKHLIKELTPLIASLHGKGIIHSDIKPSNLILDKTSSRLLLCDFGCAALEDRNGGQLGSTTQFVSPFRTLMLDAPLAKADDLYATGITMWQLYTGREPFDDVDQDFLENVIASGFQPNLLAVDDTTIRELIVSYLEAGNPPLPEGRTYRANDVCVTARVVFADCVAVPPHSHERIVHCEGCNLEKCERLYQVPDVVSNCKKENCTVCL
jgi:hypothetical protein